jgi:hypothetical protein
MAVFLILWIGLYVVHENILYLYTSCSIMLHEDHLIGRNFKILTVLKLIIMMSK